MRPNGIESARRKARFLTLIAEGSDAEHAAREAGLSPWRALRIVTEADFLDIVRAIRAGCGPVAVQVEPASDTPLAA